MVVYQIFFFQHKDMKSLPKLLKDMAQTDVTVNLRIKETNIATGENAYLATYICKGFYIPQEQTHVQSESVQ